MIAGVEYEIVSLPKSKFFGLEKKWHEEHFYWITDKEKTLIDSVDDMNRSGGIAEVIKAIRNALPEIDMQKLDSYIKSFPIGSAKKRLGFLIESIISSAKIELDVDAVLVKWSSNLTAGIIPLVPGGSPRGRINTRWKIRINSEF